MQMLISDHHVTSSERPTPLDFRLCILSIFFPHSIHMVSLRSTLWALLDKAIGLVVEHSANVGMIIWLLICSYVVVSACYERKARRLDHRKRRKWLNLNRLFTLIDCLSIETCLREASPTSSCPLTPPCHLHCLFHV